MSEKTNVLEINDAPRWNQLLKEFPFADIHFTPEYYNIFKDRGSPVMFIYNNNREKILYPFLIRKIPDLQGNLNKRYFDITSPYGYGGPLFSPRVSPESFHEFHTLFKYFCRQNNIVTEFTRFHPLLENREPVKDMIDTERNSSIFYVNLSQSIKKIWENYRHCNRKNIKKARREDISIIIENEPGHFSQFLEIYRHTMKRNKAHESYYFSPRFFNKLHYYLKGNYIYAHALKDNKVISTELLIHNDQYIHSFLGGTLSIYYPFRPNNLLKHEIIKWAHSRGMKYFILGGGKKDGDGIFRYKSTFSNDKKDYYIGKAVHNRELFEQLVNNIPGTADCKTFFPPYRRQ